MIGADLYLIDGKALQRTLGLPDLPVIGGLVHVFDRFDRKVCAKRHVAPSFFL